jgi:hypothetical protein
MGDRGPAPPERSRGEEIGTLWTLHRDESTARCELRVFERTWDLHVVVDGIPLLSQRCAGLHDVFGLAEVWRERMAKRGWKDPTTTVRPRPDRRRLSR